MGGWMLTQNIESKPGTTIESEGYRFKVKEMDGHRIVAVEVEKPLNPLLSDISASPCPLFSPKPCKEI
ncbi:transporter associated domain-containing protein [Bacillus licheniformis]|nr:transporter associated domain-containing protein [Bacillus licheniformis]